MHVWWGHQDLPLRLPGQQLNATSCAKSPNPRKPLPKDTRFEDRNALAKVVLGALKGYTNYEPLHFKTFLSGLSSQTVQKRWRKAFGLATDDDRLVCMSKTL